MRYFIRQIGDKDCAFACLKMLLAIVHKNKDYLYYPQNDCEKSYSLEEIIKIANIEGVILDAFKFKFKKDLLKQSNFPLLVPVKEGKMLHMVLIKKIKNGKIHIYDPKRGKKTYRFDEFDQVWTGQCLEVKEVHKTDFKLSKLGLIPWQYSVSIYCLQLLSFICLAASMFFIDVHVSFYVPLIFLSVFAITEIIYKRVLISEMKYFDNKILDTSFNGPTIDFKDRYSKMTNFKQIHLGTPIQLVNLCLVSILGLVLLGVNSYINLINFAIIIVVFAIMTIIQFKCLEADNKEIDSLERNILEDKITSNLDFKSRMITIQNKTYKYVNLENIKTYITGFIAVILCLFYSSLNDTVSINFLLFHLFLYLTLVKNMSKIFEIIRHVDDYKYYLCLYRFYSGN